MIQNMYFIIFPGIPKVKVKMQYSKITIKKYGHVWYGLVIF